MGHGSAGREVRRQGAQGRAAAALRHGDTRIVFRAMSSAPTLTFMDWAGGAERGGAAGGRQLVNFVRVAPYYGGF